MHPASVSAILQLDYPDRLPKGHRNAQPTAWMLWTCHGQPMVRVWLLHLELYC